jgi:hypothetical protein
MHEAPGTGAGDGGSEVLRKKATSRERDPCQAVVLMRGRRRRRRGGRYRGSGDGEAGSKSGGRPQSSCCPSWLWSKEVGKSGSSACGGERAQASGRKSFDSGGEGERKGWTRTCDRVRALLAASTSPISTRSLGEALASRARSSTRPATWSPTRLAGTRSTRSGAARARSPCGAARSRPASRAHGAHSRPGSAGREQGHGRGG